MAEAEVVIRHTDDDGVVRVMYMVLEMDRIDHGIRYGTEQIYDDPHGLFAVGELLRTEVTINIAGRDKPFSKDGHYTLLWKEDHALAE